MRKWLLILTAVLMVGVEDVRGQGVVQGVVSDGVGGVGYVNIGVVGRSEGAASDSSGRYRLEVGTGDSVTIRFSATGYERHDARVAVRGGQRLTLNVELKQQATVLDAVEVTAGREAAGTFTRIEGARVEDVVGPGGGVEALVKMLPDVQSGNELSSQYSVRGGSFDENLVYVNGVEVFRPMLIRSGQQEGMSIINGDMVEEILFSPGGFDATYGDKLSSVLDIRYREPGSFGGKVSGSLLGAAGTVWGRVGERWGYALGVRRHSNSYILGSLDTKGSYTTAYTDLQASVSYAVSEELELKGLAIATKNVYGLEPESQTTTFGSFFNPMALRIYFDGREEDRYGTLLGSLGANWHPNGDWRLWSSLSVQRIRESERYDVQSQYWLYELAQGESVGDTAMFDRGVGTFLEHARNRLLTEIGSLDLRARRYARLGGWEMGVKVQLERVSDHVREWRLVDSAGYALPATPWLVADTLPASPILQQFASSDNAIETWRVTTFAMREMTWHSDLMSEIKAMLGVRGQVYGGTLTGGTQWLLSPRGSVVYKPYWGRDLQFRLAAGWYHQPPFYREYRNAGGGLVEGLPSQKSLQVTGGVDWRFAMWGHRSTLTADVYYKYLTDIIPYRVENLRLRYMPDEEAVGYVVGASVRLNVELVEGLESWASLSVGRARENILGDEAGWMSRPTDQRVSLKVFLQDHVPNVPWWDMSLNLVYATGAPLNVPFGDYSSWQLRMPSYYRVDWGNTIRLLQFEKMKNGRLARLVDDVNLSIEVFNLFNFRNVVSYLWVSDYEGQPHRVPNYLTARQLNIKLTVCF